MSGDDPPVDPGLPAGTRLGRWMLGPVLGAGSTATVYQAVDAATGLEAAVKVLHRRNAAHGEARARFLREGRVARRVVHPNVVRVYDVGVEGMDQYIAMELLAGQTLAARLESGALPIGLAVQITVALCGALTAVAAQDVLHRDIKPGNITLVPDPQAGWTPRLLDFGFSRADDAPGAEQLRTGPGLIGTPAYMAPEAALGNRPLDIRSDLFSLGVVLYECLTGHSPFKADRLGDTLVALVQCRPAPVQSRRPEVPDALAAEVHRVLSLDPDHRHPTPEALASALAPTAHVT